MIKSMLSQYMEKKTINLFVLITLGLLLQACSNFITPQKNASDSDVFKLIRSEYYQALPEAIIFYRNYKYDRNGVLIEIDKVDSVTAQTQTEKYYYNSNNSKNRYTSQESYYGQISEYEERYAYNALGLLVSIQRYNNQVLTNCVIKKYTSNNLLLKDETYKVAPIAGTNRYDSTLFSWINYNYDTIVHSETQSCYFNGSYYGYWLLRYDSYDSLTYWGWYASDTLNYFKTWQYSYDSTGRVATTVLNTNNQDYQYSRNGYDSFNNLVAIYGRGHPADTTYYLCQRNYYKRLSEIAF